MKRTPLKKKPRKKSLAGLKLKAWGVFSKFIRQRGMDENGFNYCISCGELDHWKNLQAGHFLPKSLGLSIYFEERNVWPQCSLCNLTWQGNQIPYEIALKKRFGESITEELKALQRQPKKYYPSDYEEMIERYTSLIKG